MDILMAEMSARGYEGQRFLVGAKSFGLPCRRRRAYCVFVRVVACHAFRFSKRSVSAVCHRLCNMTAACQRMPPSVVDCLLPDDDPALAAELHRRQTARLGQQTASATLGILSGGRGGPTSGSRAVRNEKCCFRFELWRRSRLGESSAGLLE